MMVEVPASWILAGISLYILGCLNGMWMQRTAYNVATGDQ